MTDPSFTHAFIPVGSVMAYAGNLGQPIPATAEPPVTLPSNAKNVRNNLEASGWMLCDGRLLDVELYPELFSALGYNYGGGDDTFSIPDYRGYFLRGADLGASVSPQGQLARDDTSPEERTIGVIQSDALIEHTHEVETLELGSEPPGTKSVGVSTDGPSAKVELVSEKDDSGAVKIEDVNEGAPKNKVDRHETRPLNMSINYIIKYAYST